MKCLYGISIHSPLRGETIHICANASIPFISIHLLRAEQDHPIWAASSGSKIFQSTCSVRSKTAMRGHLTIVEGISIHLLRAEQDNGGVLWHASGAHFNPLAPCGARPLSPPYSPQRYEDFNPLAPCGARPKLEDFASVAGIFQSTCSVRSKTAAPLPPARRAADFNPLAPCGARHFVHYQGTGNPEISIHLLRAEQDNRCYNQSRAYCDFNPLAPCGARQQTVIKTVCKGRSYCTDHLLISPTKGTFSRKKNHPDGKTAYLWCEPIRDLV